VHVPRRGERDRERHGPRPVRRNLRQFGQQRQNAGIDQEADRADDAEAQQFLEAIGNG